MRDNRTPTMGGGTDTGVIVSATVGERRVTVHEPGKVRLALALALARIERRGPIERGSVTCSTPTTIYRDVAGVRAALTSNDTTAEETLLGSVGRRDLLLEVGRGEGRSNALRARRRKL